VDFANWLARIKQFVDRVTRFRRRLWKLLWRWRDNTRWRRHHWRGGLEWRGHPILDALDDAPLLDRRRLLSRNSIERRRASLGTLPATAAHARLHVPINPVLVILALAAYGVFRPFEDSTLATFDGSRAGRLTPNEENGDEPE
jgi:hypothetical protein